MRQRLTRRALLNPKAEIYSVTGEIQLGLSRH